MEYQIISNKGEKVALFIDDEMTVADVKGVAAAMLDAPEDVVMTVSLNGKLLGNDGETWAELRGRLFRGLQPLPMQRKLYCTVTDRPVVEVQSAEVLRMLPSKEEKKLEQERERANAAAMDSMVDSLADNPAFLQSMMSMNPMLAKMQKKSPEVARMLQDPETMRLLLKSSVNPERRREMERSLELQLAQISALPDGQQMINHYMNQFTDDLDDGDEQQPQPSAASATEAGDTLNHPDPTKDAVNDPLPNPWAAAAAPAPAASSATATPFAGPGGFPFGNPFAASAFGGAAPPGPTSFLGSGSASAPSASHSNPASMNAMLASMMQAMQATPSAPPPPAPAAATAPAPAPHATVAEDVMQRGLSVLRDMGFDDEALCREALLACAGDAEAAVDYIAEHQSE
ncbi:UBA/TS-N domain containing protein [Novymonas esmeraldas]|uniref:UBA/TS-N domain containing protein n=1 Tax=Novymonas esmeraldas TaxID=1808958 RepID=A0AAW0FA61_9TRYP